MQESKQHTRKIESWCNSKWFKNEWTGLQSCTRINSLGALIMCSMNCDCVQRRNRLWKLFWNRATYFSFENNCRNPSWAHSWLSNRAHTLQWRGSKFLIWCQCASSCPTVRSLQSSKAPSRPRDCASRPRAVPFAFRFSTSLGTRLHARPNLSNVAAFFLRKTSNSDLIRAAQCLPIACWHVWGRPKFWSVAHREVPMNFQGLPFRFLIVWPFTR